jgi:hypothetical protein
MRTGCRVYSDPVSGYAAESQSRETCAGLGEEASHGCAGPGDESLHGRKHIAASDGVVRFGPVWTFRLLVRVGHPSSQAALRGHYGDGRVDRAVAVASVDCHGWLLMEDASSTKSGSLRSDQIRKAGLAQQGVRISPPGNTCAVRFGRQKPTRPGVPTRGSDQPSPLPADQYLTEKTKIARQHLEAKSEWELIGMTPQGPEYRAPMEMARRLKESIDSLRGELTAFKGSSDNWAKRLFWLTWMLVALTIVIAVLSGVLLAQG